MTYWLGPAPVEAGQNALDVNPYNLFIRTSGVKEKTICSDHLSGKQVIIKKQQEEGSEQIKKLSTIIIRPSKIKFMFCANLSISSGNTPNQKSYFIQLFQSFVQSQSSKSLFSKVYLNIHCFP